jgi:hypothetical protein
MLAVFLGFAGMALTPGTASAQFYFGRSQQYNYQFNYGPSFNPYFYVPQFRFQQSSYFSYSTPFGSASFGFYRYSYGPSPAAAWALAPAVPFYYGQAGSGLTVGSTQNNLALQAQRDLANAQRVMSGLRKQGDYYSASLGENPKVATKVDLPNGIALDQALAPADPKRIASGEALNDLLREILIAEKRGLTRPSAFLPTLLLDDVRFGETDLGDAANLVRLAGGLPFPTAFDDAEVRDVRVALAQDFAAIATAVRAGKLPESAKLTKFAVAIETSEAVMTTRSNSLTGEQLTAVRRFLAQLHNAHHALKVTEAVGVIDPKWATEGTSVADFAKHMGRHKLQFGPAPVGAEESYQTLHRNMASYLFALTQPKK